MVRTTVLALMIPMNLLLMAWLGYGRMLVLGNGGWMVLFMTVFVLPVVFLCLLTTTILAFNQKTRPRLTDKQTSLQLVIWIAMFAYGFAMGDGGDGPPLPSIYETLTGDSTSPIEDVILVTAMCAAPVAWIWLLVALIRGAQQPPAPNWGAATGPPIPYYPPAPPPG